MARVVYLDGEPIRDPVGVLERILTLCTEWAECGTPSVYVGGRTWGAEVLLEVAADTGLGVQSRAQGQPPT